MFGLGFGELLLILLIVVFVFGAGKLPRIMGDLASGIKAFKSNIKDEKKPEQISETDNNKSAS